MICPRCQTPLGVYMTARGVNLESRDYKCPSCSYRATSLNFLIERPQGDPKGAVSRSILGRAEMGVFEDLRAELQQRFPKVPKDQSSEQPKEKPSSAPKSPAREARGPRRP